MKDKEIIPTDKEIVMRENDFIVSKTDLKGRITYGNRIFQEFSRYSEAELLGSQHNIIRHPDMPRAAFQLAWDTIKAGNEFFGYVKNMAKDGSFYWVFTHITPSYDLNGQMIGYLSVRRKPRMDSVKIVEGLYKQMLALEKNAGSKNAIAVSTKFLLDFLEEKRTGYDELILALQG
ncbi:MAG: PAS domain-containing protein [Gammaproteobacteria bacterium]|nr:PAS domain-containing protein [Gammaproteobacteria bacterium]